MIGGGVKISDHSVIEDNVIVSGGTVVFGKLKKQQIYRRISYLAPRRLEKNAVFIKKLKDYIFKHE